MSENNWIRKYLNVKQMSIVRTFAVCTDHCTVSEVRSNEIRDKIFVGGWFENWSV